MQVWKRSQFERLGCGGLTRMEKEETKYTSEAVDIEERMSIILFSCKFGT